MPFGIIIAIVYGLWNQLNVAILSVLATRGCRMENLYCKIRKFLMFLTGNYCGIMKLSIKRNFNKESMGYPVDLCNIFGMYSLIK